jgi:DNA (cytosine-5)-methyltransferase 1
MLKNMKQLNLFNTSKPSKSWFVDALVALNASDDKIAWPDIFGQKLYEKLKNKNKINILSLFSGGGGLDIGFRDAGFNIIECVEIEKKFTDTLEKNSNKNDKFCNTIITNIDIREYTPQVENIDFIIGGPPCQTFSAAGARAAGVKGLTDQRGTLFEEYVRILKKLQPKGFLFENVYRIVGAQKGKPWQLIQEAFKNAGYKLHWRIIDAADYGVPQHRERLIIVGVKNGDFLFPYPTHGPDSEDCRPYYNAKSAVQEIDTSECKVGINGRHGYLLDNIPPGLNYSFYTEKMGHPNPIFGWRSKFSDYLYKADPDKPVRTIKAQGGQYTGPFSWQNRPFNVEELKRLQTFPDSYKIVGSRQTSIMQLGNSVPPQAGRILAISVLSQIFKINLPFEVNLMPNSMELGFRKRKSSLTKVYAKKAKEAIINQSKAGLFKKKISVTSQGEVTQYLNNGIELNDVDSQGAITFNFKFNLNSDCWDFIVSDEQNFKKKYYSIEINLSGMHSHILGTKKIILSSLSESYYSLVAIWKYLEKTLKEIAHKDDLIQLFGYYQYKQDSSFNFGLLNNELSNKNFWILAKNITNGIAIGKQLHIDEISEVFQLDKKIFLEEINNLKKIGFEIRNHNTNSQIKNDYFLIPYQFPTLNKRSLQRLTYLQ